MTKALQLGCSTHPEREAAAACLACARPLCRECVLETGGHITCRTCLEAPILARRDGGRFASAWKRAPLAVLGMAGLWAVFYVFLQWMVSRPGQYLLH